MSAKTHGAVEPVRSGAWRLTAFAGEVRDVMAIAGPALSMFIQLEATVGSRRGSMVVLRWKNIDLAGGRITFERSIAESVRCRFDRPVGLDDTGQRRATPRRVSAAFGRFDLT
jgi:hypothetical protein